jgi:hypothetical protein
MISLASVAAGTVKKRRHPGRVKQGARDGNNPCQTTQSRVACTVREEPIEFLERVVNIHSATQNLGGVRKVGEVFRAEFNRLGFEMSWEEMPPEMHRAGHLIAERKGTVGKRLLLIGHLDAALNRPALDLQERRHTLSDRMAGSRCLSESRNSRGVNPPVYRVRPRRREASAAKSTVCGS